ncbi:MAG: hypothetical protein JKY52_08510 [Flavobacteriales bacterium]|nr:hypothetical protein [Flavobacteriales bacterium]
MSKYITLIDSMRTAQIPDHQIVDCIYNMEPATKTKATKVVRKEYSESFEVFWKSYPPGPKGTKSAAFNYWEELDTPEKLAAMQGLIPYAKELRDLKDRSCLHVERYINRKRWESFDEPGLALAVDVVKLDKCTETHAFLKECRKDGASERDIKYWSCGRLICSFVGGKKICAVDREMGDFDQSFGETIKRLGYSIWTKEMFERKTA